MIVTGPYTTTFTFYRKRTMQINWHAPEIARPRHVIQMFVVDYLSRIMLIHRSNEVRSAKNVWSIPSGEHDIGESVTDCASRELMEEFSLTPVNVQIIDQYENIAGDKPAKETYEAAEAEVRQDFDLGDYEADDSLIETLATKIAKLRTPQYHWVMSLYGCVVPDVHKHVNNEPNRHDNISIIPLSVFGSGDMSPYEFHPSFQWLIDERRSGWASQLLTLIGYTPR